jgi:hypothetical protein
VCPKDGSRWLNLYVFFNWKQVPPADMDPIDTERRDLWYRCTGYLIRDADAEKFMNWAESVDFSSRMMLQPLEIHEIFLGEYGWSPAWRNLQKDYFSDENWLSLDKDCPVEVQAIVSEYHYKSSEFDCSADDNCTITLLSSDIVSGLELLWSGYGSDFIDETGRIIAFDPTAHAEGPSALLMRPDQMKEFLVREKLRLCWTVNGEKFVHGTGFSPRNFVALRLSGAYILGPEGPTGFLKCFFENRAEEDGEISIVPLVSRPSSRIELF